MEVGYGMMGLHQSMTPLQMAILSCMIVQEVQSWESGRIEAAMTYSRMPARDQLVSFYRGFNIDLIPVIPCTKFGKNKCSVRLKFSKMESSNFEFFLLYLVLPRDQGSRYILFW
mgnify:CR=1 FL=1